MKKLKFAGFGRVDTQVFFFTASLVVISCLFIYFVSYYICYNDVIYTLTERVDSIHSYLDDALDKTTFQDINEKSDIERPSYKEMHNLFERIKRVTGVQYLYTAKRSDDGRLIYVIDGLPYGAEDFRFPGDLIEGEISDDLSRALAGEAVLPKEIVDTGWGEIFIAYMPIHNSGGGIAGAIGIEFFATHQYKAYRELRRFMPFVIFFSCVLCALFAVMFFRRISNPTFQDLATTDYLTGLKNRNAYELDTANLCALGAADGYGFILADLNGLKRVNDTMGHGAGDIYIKGLADAMREASTQREVLYRIGGDEFGVLIRGATTEQMKEYISQVKNCFVVAVGEQIEDASCSFGYSICEGSAADTFEVAYRLADEMMYVKKREYYGQSGRF